MELDKKKEMMVKDEKQEGYHVPSSFFVQWEASVR